ncbi:MAG: LptE family protein [Rhodothermales bacterium]
MKTFERGRGNGEEAKGERKEGGEKLRRKPSLIPPFSRPFIPSQARRFTLAATLTLALAGCGYYSFTGATIPEQLNTIAVPLAENNATSPVATLDQDLTELLINRFVGQTRLSLEQNEPDADAVLNTSIQRYANEPTSVSGDERATRNRVTLAVAVDYIDQTTDEPLLQRTFTGFSEYDPIAEGLSGEEQAAQAALEIIADDIFTAATSNW